MEVQFVRKPSAVVRRGWKSSLDKIANCRCGGGEQEDSIFYGYSTGEKTTVWLEEVGRWNFVKVLTAQNC